MRNFIPDSLKDEVVDTSDQAFIDAGFSAERVGKTTVYERDLSDDVIEASRAFTRKRAIGYRSRDIRGRKPS